MYYFLFGLIRVDLKKIRFQINVLFPLKLNNNFLSKRKGQSVDIQRRKSYITVFFLPIYVSMVATMESNEKYVFVNYICISKF